MADSIIDFLNKFDDVMYYPVLIIILAAAGLYFSVRSGFVQLRLFTEACRLITEKPAKGEQKISSFQALIVSTASRVGTGNIVGVSTAICIGGSTYYIEEALKKPVISVPCIFLIATYAAASTCCASAFQGSGYRHRYRRAVLPEIMTAPFRKTGRGVSMLCV